MKNFKTLAVTTLITSAILTGKSSTSQDIQQIFSDKQMPQTEKGINMMTTAPTWKQYKPTDYGLATNHLVSIYYDQQGQSFVAGGDG
jgi:hypothetical protein